MFLQVSEKSFHFLLILRSHLQSLQGDFGLGLPFGEWLSFANATVARSAKDTRAELHTYLPSKLLRSPPSSHLNTTRGELSNILQRTAMNGYRLFPNEATLHYTGTAGRRLSIIKSDFTYSPAGKSIANDLPPTTELKKKSHTKDIYFILY